MHLLQVLIITSNVEQRYMSLQGKVIEVSDKCVIVEVIPRPECQGCHACTGLLDGEKRSKTRQIKALAQGFDLTTGDEVIIDLNPGEGSIVALLLFGIPILAFFAGLAVTPYLCALLSLELNDLSRVVAGFSFMGLAFAGLACFSRTRHAEKLTMRVQQKIG